MIFTIRDLNSVLNNLRMRVPKSGMISALDLCIKVMLQDKKQEIDLPEEEFLIKSLRKSCDTFKDIEKMFATKRKPQYDTSS